MYVTYFNLVEIGPLNLPDHVHLEAIKYAIRNILSTSVTSNWWTEFSSWEDFHGLLRTGTKLSIHSVVSEIKVDNYTFIEKMINHGKILLFTSSMLTDTEDSKIIGYTNEEFSWALKNEKDIWANFIKNEYLFSSDNNLDSRFINLAPFSKFYLSIDNDSPSMIGKFIGWKIVKSFMKVNSSSLNELIQYDPMYIYNNSKYKPSNYE